MADDLQAGICSSGSSWWNPARSGGFDGQATSSAAASVSCSTAIADVGGGFSWAASEMVEGRRSYDEPVGSASGSSVTFQDTHKTQPLDYMVGSPMMDSSLQIHSLGLSPSTMDWTQALLRSSGRAETSFHAMLQEDLSSRLVFRQDPAIDSDQAHAGAGDPTANPYAEMNQSFLLDQHHLSSGDSFQLAPTSYGCPTTELQGLFEPDSKPQQSNYDDRPMNYQAPMMGYCESSSELPQPSWPKFPAAPKQQSSNQLHFSNNTQFWNASAAAASEARSDFYPRTQPESTAQTFEQKPNCSNHTVKSNPEGVRGSSSSATKRSGGSSSEPALKRPRIETPSPLPTFKVRKEKLGDRITALQQLVSPFGKTDTASVLHEAIEYIKLLHDQVLSTPYLKNGHPMQHQQNPDQSSDSEGPKQDLRSRGLCLVPIASTYPMASEALVDFWTPMATFGGSFR